MICDLTVLEARIRLAVAQDDFEAALRLSETYTRGASDLLRRCDGSEERHAILRRHTTLMEWMRLSAGAARAHAAEELTQLARATRFRPMHETTTHTRMDV
jgi:hypothetical protein